MNRARVVITGVGFITPIGNDRTEVTASLRENRSGLSAVDWFPGCPVRVAGTVKGFGVDSLNRLTWTFPPRYNFPRETIRSLPPHGVYALCALEQAIADAGLSTEEISSADTGLFCASAGSPRFLRHHLNEVVDSAGQRLHPWGVVTSIAGTLNFNLAAHYKIRGPVTGFVSACAASTHAIGYAMDEITLGRQRRMLVAAAEEPVWESLLPFAGMRALSRETDTARASRPFDRKRDGFVGAGGGAALVLENADDARARGATVYAELAGWGHSADGFSIAMPEPEGRGLEAAIRRALASAEAEPSQVDFVHAHATSTPTGDRAEAVALARIFGVGPSSPRVSSTKGLTGHTLSMSGAMETAFSAVALKENFVPGNSGLVETDVDAPALNFPRSSENIAVDRILKNSSGFGGSNVCLVLKRWTN